MIPQSYEVEYKISYEVSRLNQSLEQRMHFNLKQIRELFEEINLYFPKQLDKEYEQLIEFNKTIIQERNNYHENILEKKNEQLKDIRDELYSLNIKRKNLLNVVIQDDIFVKYKKYQSELVEIDLVINTLLKKLDDVDIVKSIQANFKKIAKSLTKAIEELQEHMELPNNKYITIKSFFRKLSKDILNDSAIL